MRRKEGKGREKERREVGVRDLSLTLVGQSCALIAEVGYRRAIEIGHMRLDYIQGNSLR